MPYTAPQRYSVGSGIGQQALQRGAVFLPRLEGAIQYVDNINLAEDGEDLVGFLIGFLSQTKDDEAYIHFVGVSPEHRGEGLGRELYERFFEEARGHGRTVVRCVTSPVNEDSVAFHEALGFEVDRVVEDYDGPGEDRVLLVKRLG